MVVGLILISSPASRTVVKLMPFLAVSVTILFVFMLLYGFISGKKEDVLNTGLKIVLSIIFALALITALLFITGWWDPVYSFMFQRESSGQIWINVVIILILAGAVVAVLRGEKGNNE